MPAIFCLSYLLPYLSLNIHTNVTFLHAFLLFSPHYSNTSIPLPANSCFIYFFFLSVSVSSQCAGSEMKPLTEDRGCDSALLGQSDRTPHWAVIDEYGAMVE
jgi:hypothetical protein